MTTSIPIHAPADRTWMTSTRLRNRHAGVASIVAPVMVRVRPLVRRQTDVLSTLGAAGTVVNQ
jgi:hypothetical protein